MRMPVVFLASFPSLITSKPTEAERLAKIRRCRHVYVDTMEYQAPRFYLVQWFQNAGEIPDSDSHGHAKYHLTRQIDELLENL